MEPGHHGHGGTAGRQLPPARQDGPAKRTARALASAPRLRRVVEGRCGHPPTVGASRPRRGASPQARAEGLGQLPLDAAPLEVDDDPEDDDPGDDEPEDDGPEDDERDDGDFEDLSEEVDEPADEPAEVSAPESEEVDEPEPVEPESEDSPVEEPAEAPDLRLSVR